VEQPFVGSDAFPASAPDFSAHDEAEEQEEEDWVLA